MLVPRSSDHSPPARIPHIIGISTLDPSTIAASTTWPLPELCRSHSAARMPTIRNIDPPPKSPVRFSGGTGRSALVADGVQQAVEGDVVDVVAGLLAARTGLAPAGHAGVDQPLVDLGAVLGPEAEPLGDARPIALDQHVGLGDQREHQFAALVGLQVGRDRAPVAVHGLMAAFRHSAGSARAFDADHVGAEIAEDHRRVRSGADAGQFDDSQSLQWSRH